MGEIKFRAWVGNEMIYDWFRVGVSDIDGRLISMPDLLKADVVMQYTGLKDKNGKEIYEGDVLDNGMYPHVMIFWDKEYAGFRVTTYSCIKKLSEYVNNWEVIGNIYENPELLK